MNKFMAAVFATFMLTTTTQALQVYEDDVGQWKIHGHLDGTNTACILSTYWPDGSKININVFPRNDGTQYTTMTVQRPSWNATVGNAYRGTVVFYSKFGNHQMNGEFDIIESNKIIARGLTNEFSDWFIRSNVMTLFPNTTDELSVGLRGTSAAMYSLHQCMSKIR